MQRIIIIAAVVLLGAGSAVTTAKAEQNYGPLADTAKGSCFSRSPYNDLGFGFWSECPKPAATTTAHRRHAKHTQNDAHPAQ